ncbi:hypothetical protein PR048_004899 [Dryococelus australis]|uniref:Uncharacterized protein n=1 Tax=Dryococelus australis TaxID=614101 RepID=A0ABQ9I6Q9_9NEOP|nr:hypothetical protein PR048_004899 [Dryococelus australis]
MPLIGGFSRGSPVPPLHYGASPFSLNFTFIGSQYLVVKSSPNLFTQLVLVSFPTTYRFYVTIRTASAFPLACFADLQWTQSVGAPPIWSAGGSGFEFRIPGNGETCEKKEGIKEKRCSQGERRRQARLKTKSPEVLSNSIDPIENKLSAKVWDSNPHSPYREQELKSSTLDRSTSLTI